MLTLVPRNSLMGTLAGPLLWSAYFVLSYIIAGAGCSLGLGAAAGEGLSGIQWGLIGTGIGFALLILVAGGQAELGRRRAKRAAGVCPEDERPDHERHRFLYAVALFLCGLSLIGTLWLALNAVIVAPCQG